MRCRVGSCYYFFFNDTATTEIYTLSLHDALPISDLNAGRVRQHQRRSELARHLDVVQPEAASIADEETGALHKLQIRSEEHTSELQSRQYLVCRLLLEKKKTTLSIHRLYLSAAFL